MGHPEVIASVVVDAKEDAPPKAIPEPSHVQSLMIDRRGYRVPWFVDLAAPYRDGCPDFRIMDGKHLKLAVREKRCWLCGRKLMGEAGTFVAGPMCGVNRNAAEPPCHLECARWSVQVCPFLSHPKRIRDERELPSGQMAGVGILRNPGVSMLWTTTGYETWKPENGGVLFDIGEPSAVEWWREKRPATRAEVEESLETGLPSLLKIAAQQGALACFQLGQQAGEFMQFLPPLMAPLEGVHDDAQPRSQEAQKPFPDLRTGGGR